MPLKIKPLSEHRDRRTFSCGEAELDDYFRRRAGQDERCNVARIFVAVSDDLSVAGFYSLSTCAINPGQLPEQIARRLLHYETIPAALAGRLARDLRTRGKGVGELLVADAVKRVLGADRSIAIWRSWWMRKTSAPLIFIGALVSQPLPRVLPDYLFPPRALEKLLQLLDKSDLGNR